MRPSKARTAAAVVLLLLSSLPAFAQSPVPKDVLERRAAELVRWISARSDYPPTAQSLPQFVFLSPQMIRHGFSNSSLGYSPSTSGVRAAQVKGMIYLPDTFVLGSDDYMLLHELVHHLQDESGRTFECLAMREREAYMLQTAFVQETGIGLMPNDMFMLMLRCDIR
jgi:hypothetical protein